MRDRYLFRGKRTDSGEWVYGGVLQTDKWTDIPIVKDYEGNINEPPSYYVESHEVIAETVGQYIGFNDKNGTRIFEGDIVNDEQSGYNYFIKWFPEYACFSLADKNGNMEFGCDEFEIFLDDLIVIGNIYDNPEFLKGE